MSYNDPCNGGCGNSKRDCSCPEEKPIRTVKLPLDLFLEDSDFMDFLELILEWHEDNDELKESFPDGMRQFLEECSDNPKKHALMLIDYLYASNDNLKELISNFKILKTL